MSAKVYQLKLEAEESVGTIFSTRNYEQFKLLKENRDITNVNGLKRSITKHGLLMPILVNETFEIIEGQHRFLACKSLKVPIHYIVRKGATKDMIIPINVDRRSWGYKDYLKYYQDNSNYTRLSSFMAEWGVSLNVVTAILYTNDCGADFALPFKKGTFLFGPEQIKTCESVMARLLEIGNVNGGKYRSRLLAGRTIPALVSLIQNKKYNHKRFLKRLEEVPSYEIKSVHRKLDGKLMIESIYNAYLKESERVTLTVNPRSVRK